MPSYSLIMTKIKKLKIFNNFLNSLFKNLLKKNISLSFLKSCFFYLYLFFAICIYIPDIHIIGRGKIYYTTILIGLFALPLHLSKLLLYKKYSIIFYFIYFICISNLICSLVINKGGFSFLIIIIIITLSNLSGLIFLVNKNLNISVVSLIFISVFTYYFYYIININNDSYTSVNIVNVNISTLTFVDISRNAISVTMIMPVILVYIAYHQSTKLIPLWPAIMTFIVCVWAIGRSGIISSGLLLIGIIFLKIIQMRKLLFKLAIVFSILLFLLFIMLNIEDIISNYFPYFKLAGTDLTGREEIWNHYFNQIKNPMYFVFGGELDSYMMKWDYNYHNSFITLHYQIGIFAIPVMVAIVISLFRYLLNNKLYFLLLLVLILRINTDYLMFFSCWDFLIYYLLLKNFIKKE